MEEKAFKALVSDIKSLYFKTLEDYLNLRKENFTKGDSLFDDLNTKTEDIFKHLDSIATFDKFTNLRLSMIKDSFIVELECEFYSKESRRSTIVNSLARIKEVTNYK